MLGYLGWLGFILEGKNEQVLHQVDSLSVCANVEDVSMSTQQLDARALEAQLEAVKVGVSAEVSMFIGFNQRKSVAARSSGF